MVGGGGKQDGERAHHTHRDCVLRWVLCEDVLGCGPLEPHVPLIDTPRDCAANVYAHVRCSLTHPHTQAWCREQPQWGNGVDKGSLGRGRRRSRGRKAMPCTGTVRNGPQRYCWCSCNNNPRPCSSPAPAGSSPCSSTPCTPAQTQAHCPVQGAQRSTLPGNGRGAATAAAGGRPEPRGGCGGGSLAHGGHCTSHQASPGHATPRHHHK